ncbi:MAG: sulfatase-like hydrolase/transferase [bacterium]|nr:sulfatase-like hydrolase/transferase [bacterium]
MSKFFLKIIDQLKSGLFIFAGSFIIVAGWNWYHLAKRPHSRFVVISLTFWLVLIAGFYLFKWLFVHLCIRFRRHPFWGQEFSKYLDRVFFSFSLVFLIFFSKNELLSLAWAAAVFILVFSRLRVYLSEHPLARPWLTVHRSVFTLGGFIFLLASAYQYFSFHYYILDSSSKFFNIAFFRAWCMTAFWLAGFALSSILYWRFRGRHRYLPILCWGVLFLLVIGFWLMDIGILFFSGLHLSPFMLGEVNGAGQLFFTGTNMALLVSLPILMVAFGLIMRKIARAHLLVPSRYWYYYNWSIIVIAFFSIIGLASFKNTPEYFTVKSFINYYTGSNKKVVLDPSVQAKLERFGLHYNTETFFVARKNRVYQTTKDLLPKQLLVSKPNIIIIFLESFSARLTGVYEPKYADLTPNLLAMTEDPHTTVFKNFYNASTPTITGTLADLCSFYTPIGHNEIEIDKHLQRHYLLCLPEMLKKYAGFKRVDYITAVDKDYANKDGIFKSMGVDRVWGTTELSAKIAGEPLAWGYSDHQLFPFLFDWMNTNAGNQPFLGMLATVDTHPPFNSVKDVLKYREGNNNLLNTFYTTDNAFGLFWRQFKQSQFYDNTIVVAVADHAVFPAAYTADTMPATGRPNFYDEIFFSMYVPGSVLPKEVKTYSSSADLAPTILQMLKVNEQNSFEGHSIFDDRDKYPNILGMHEFGLYINQIYPDGKRGTSYDIPSHLECSDKNFTTASTTPLSLCELSNFYKWKRNMLEEGRFWKN